MLRRSHADHLARYEAVRDLERDTGRPIGIMLDLQVSMAEQKWTTSAV